MHSKKLVLITTVLALVVIVLGAYTRLTDSGLGCPDWPGCYGNFIGNDSKAHIEMLHRYVAGFLGILILIINYMAFKYNFAKKLAVVILLLVIFQALLGMWTVTLKLLPIVVMGHLLGGFTILSLLYLLVLRSSHEVT